MCLNTKRHKENAIRIILIALNISVAVLIFILSSQPAEISGPLSEGVIYRILDLLTGLSEEKLIIISSSLNGIARKLAHFSVYALLSVLMNLLLLRYNIKYSKGMIISFALCFLYAVSDEIHQYFVPGRSCEFRDVMIDSCGILSGIIIICLIKLIKSKLRKV